MTMKENYIHQILKQFFTNSYPPEIEEKVQRWIINEKWNGVKNQSLTTIWHNTKIVPNENTYKALAKVKATIKRLEDKKNHPRMSRILLRSAAVIIPLLLLAGSYFYIYQDVRMIEVTTSGNEQKQCTLPDGSIVLLNSCTKITYPSEFKETTRNITLEGEAYFSVTSDAAKPFIVKTNDLSVKVLGTKFNISAYPTNDRTIATLNSGKIQVDVQSGKPDSRYIIQPNQEFVFNKIDKSVSIHTTTDETIDWKNGWLIFQNATFNDIMNTIERRYNVTIDYNKLHFPNIPYTIKFIHNESLVEVLDILKDVAGGFTYQIKDSKITLIKEGGE